MLMAEIRLAIEEGRFEAWRAAFLSEYLTDERREELRIYAVGQVPENASDRQRAGTRDDDDVDDAPQRDEEEGSRGGRKHGEGYHIATPKKGAPTTQPAQHKGDKKADQARPAGDKAKPQDDAKPARPHKGIRRDSDRPSKPRKK
jgi:hypothetical protein